MISFYGSAAFAIVIVACLAAWHFLARNDAPATLQHRPGERSETSLLIHGQSTDEREWCEAIERVAGVCAFCFDDSLSLTAAGPDGVSLARDEGGRGAGDRIDGRVHLVDVMPARVAPAMIELAAAVRRRETACRDFDLSGGNFRASATWVGEGRMLFLIAGGIDRDAT